MVTEAARLPASTMMVPTRVDSALDVATQIDTCQVHEELEQPLDVTFVSDFLQLNFLAAAMMSLCACFLRRESIIPRGSEWPSSTCKRYTMVLLVSRSSSVARSRGCCSSLLSRR